MRFLKALTAGLLAAVAVAAIMGFGVLEGWWRKPLASPGDTGRFLAAATERLRAESKGNAAFILVENGRPVDRGNGGLGMQEVSA